MSDTERAEQDDEAGENNLIPFAKRNPFCVFRTMVNIDSGAKLPAVPEHGEQRFRADGDHFFG